MSEIEPGMEPHDGERLAGVGPILGDYLDISLRGADELAAEGYEAHSVLKDNDGFLHDVVPGSHKATPANREGHYWLHALSEHKIAIGTGALVSGAAILAAVSKMRQRKKE